jgi:hypothetical protein
MADPKPSDAYRDALLAMYKMFEFDIKKLDPLPPGRGQGPIDGPEFMGKINDHPDIAHILRLAGYVDRGLLSPDEAFARMERRIGKIQP